MRACTTRNNIEPSPLVGNLFSGAPENKFRDFPEKTDELIAFAREILADNVCRMVLLLKRQCQQSEKSAA